MGNELQQGYQPVRLIDLDATFASSAGISRFYATRDIGIVAGAFWHGRVIGEPSVERSMMETFYGVQEVSTATVRLANADGYLNNLYLNDPRGITVTIMRYDRDAVTGSTYTATELVGKVSDCEMGEGWIELTIVAPDLTIFERQLPTTLVTSSLSAKAVDLGAVIPVVFGNVEKMRLPYINDDTVNNYYDYLVGHGSLSVTTVYRDNAAGTLSLVSSGEYTVSTVLYAGYTVIRFTTRQVNFANAFHALYADVEGFPLERNFAKAVRTWLNNGAFGLGQAVDATSFDQAESDMNAVGNMYCDGFLTEQRQAQDVLRELLMVRGMRLAVSATGQWTLTVDKQAAASTTTLSDGPGFGHRNLLRVGSRRRPAIESRVSQVIVRYRFDDYSEEGRLEAKQTVSASGREQVVEHHWIRDPTTADKVACYLARREQYASETLDVEVTQEGRALAEGELVTLTYAPLAISNQTWEVRRVTKELDRIRLILNSWSASIYSYSASSNPGDVAIVTVTPTLSSSTPAVPTGVALATGTTITPDGTTQAYLQITWNANTEPYLAGYELWYRRQTDAQYTITRVGLVTSFRAWGVLPSTLYEVYIKAYSTTGQASALSSVQTITTAQDTSLPSNLSGVTATAIYKAAVLRWNSVTDTDFDVVEIWRSTTNDSGSAARVGQSRGLAYVDDALESGVTYYYWLRGRDRTGSVGAFHTTQFNGTTATPPLLTGSDLVTTQAIITNSAQIAFALITDAHIVSLSANKITAGTITADLFESTLYGDLSQAMAYANAMLSGTADFSTTLTNAQIDAGTFSGLKRDPSRATPLLHRTLTRQWGSSGAWWGNASYGWGAPVNTGEGSWTSDGTTDMGANQTGKCEVWCEVETPLGASPAPTIVVEAQFKKSGGTSFGTNAPDYDNGSWATLTDQGVIAGGVKHQYLSAVFSGVRYLKIRIKLTPGDANHPVYAKDPEIRFNDVRITADKLHAGTETNGYLLEYDNTQPGKMKWADFVVTTAKIQDAAVTAAKLATDAVTTAKIADANVTTAKINNDAVTQDKIADAAVGTAQLKNATGSATGNVGTSPIAIAMNDYNFAPNYYGDGGGYYVMSQSSTSTGETARCGIVARDAYASNYTIRWRYVTASDDPHLYVAVDLDGRIVGVWVSDDPLPNGEVPLIVPGCETKLLRAADLAPLAMPQEALDAADALIGSRRLKPEHRLYRALQVLANDAAPSRYLWQNMAWDQTGNVLRHATEDENTSKRPIPVVRMW